MAYKMSGSRQFLPRAGTPFPPGKTSPQPGQIVLDGFVSNPAGMGYAVQT
jgi:hypothetical protein